MSAKQRHYASILKESDIIMHQIERSYGAEKENDYKNICTLRNMVFVDLILIGTPFIIMAEDNIIRISYDEKIYDMPLNQFKRCVSEEQYNHILSQKQFKPIDNDEEARGKSRFDMLKEKLQEYQSGRPLQIEEEISAMQEEMNNDRNAFRLDDISQSDIRKNGAQNRKFDEIVDMRISKRGIAKLGNTAEIGFIGIEHGAGTTHTAIMFAQALANDKNVDVAFFEANKHGHMMSLAAWITGETITKSFPIGDVDYYFGMSYLVFLSKYKDMYDYVVIDFGCYGEENDADFARVNNRFVVSSGADWNLPALEEFYYSYMFDRAHIMTYLIPFLNESDALCIRENIRIVNNVYPVPFEKNPFDVKEDVLEFILKICGIENKDNESKKDIEKKEDILVDETIQTNVSTDNLKDEDGDTKFRKKKKRTFIKLRR